LNYFAQNGWHYLYQLFTQMALFPQWMAHFVPGGAIGMEHFFSKRGLINDELLRKGTGKDKGKE
jgi:hypothetical protein